MTDTPLSLPTNLSGQTIKGYVLQELIGQGGFGAVYRAYQPAVKREVAIKAILPEYANHPEFIRRFEAEAQVVAQVEHIHIVPLYDYWRDANGAFLVMRWLRGGSLRGVLERGRWPLDDLPRLLDQITAALALAHRHGIVHRDLKPDNILLDEEQNAYLADFGIAKDILNLNNTLYAAEEKQGAMLGSPYYLSPEQIKSDPVSPQSDIYSLGIMLYELLAGNNPLHGLPLSLLVSKHLQEPLPTLTELHPNLPDALNRVIEHATEKDPAKRYPNVLVLNADFRKALALTEGIGSTEAVTADFSPLTPDELARLGITEEITDMLDPINPYKGLRAFQESDAEDFHGREALIDRLLTGFNADANRRFLAVVGPSGSGKSSAVKAGLLPRLRQGAAEGSQNWFIVEMTPGAHPLEELEAALLRVAINPPASLLSQLKEDERGLVRAIKRILPSAATSESELLLVIDQFEEVFTMTGDEAERAHFLNLLTAAAHDPHSRLRVISTLRADFYDRPLLYEQFGELVRSSTEVVLPLTRAELEQAVVQPAEDAGLRLESSLVTAIVVDVGEQPGALPLLQFALTELFERRSGRWLTLQAYHDIGGISGALARRADELYDGLDADGQKRARQLFLRLVTLNEGAEDTRRRARLDELLSLQGDEAVMQRVIDAFGKYRLLTFDRDPATRTPTAEIAHEALIRQWGRLRTWLQEDREGLRIQRRLSAAAEEWANAGRDSGYVASGTRLDQFEAWAKDTDLALTATESAYLEASLTARRQQQATEAARQAKEAVLERRSRSFLRALVAVLALATLGALGLSAVALNQSLAAQENAATATFAQGDAQVQANNAATAAAVAQDNAAQARSLAFASNAQLALSDHNTDLAILLALEANQNGQSTLQTQRTLAEAAAAPGTRRVFAGHDGRVVSAAFSPDGIRAVSGGRDNAVIIWDVTSGAILHRLQGHTDWVWDAAFSPDGKTILSASQDKTLIVWDAESGAILHTLTGHTDAVRSISFSADGKSALSGSADGSLILWDVAAGSAIRSFAAGSPVNDVAFSKSGYTALSVGQGTAITLWNVQSGERLTQYGTEGDGHTADIFTVAYLPDESGMITGSEDNSLILWSFESSQPVRRFSGHSARVTQVAVSADGTLAASVSEDNQALVWDVNTGAIRNTLIGHTAPVYGVAFAPSGNQLLTAAYDGALRLWDLQSGAQARLFAPQAGAVLAVDISPDGKQALTGTQDGRVILWDVSNGAQVRVLEGHSGAVNAVAFSADGQRALSGSDDLSLILWNLSDGRSLQRFGGADSTEGHSDAVWAAALSPDGRIAASGSRDNTLILWDTATGAMLNRLFGHTFRVTDAAFSPDGTQLISSSYDNTLILWNVTTGTEIRRFEGHSDWARSAAFSPDGQFILSGAADNTLILWETATGKRLRQYEGHTAQIYSVAFSPDGRYGLSGSADSSVILWDIASGEAMRRYDGHGDDVRSVTFSPDGRFALSGSSDGTARLWQFNLPLDELIGWTQANRYVRTLTCAERERYNVPPLCPKPTLDVQPGSV
jgi:WD40 repeat protein/serine/threonine protein kinase